MSKNRIQILPHDVSSSIRAGQVIGSVTRALEELCRNSILHGDATNISVTIGERKNPNVRFPSQQATKNDKTQSTSSFGKEFFIEVTDDGVGIDKDALERYIGTEYCTSKRTSDSSTLSKGESLKSLATLCLEMRIVTRLISKNDDDQDQGMVYEKILKEGGSRVTFGNKGRLTVLNHPNMSTHRSGTTVTLYGLFHHHGIRRQQYERYHSTKTSIEKWKEVHMARSCISQLAIAFPTVTFRLLLARADNPISNTIDSVWSIPEEGIMGNRKSWSNTCPYARKLHQVVENKENQSYSFRSVDFSNQKNATGMSRTKTALKPTRLFQGDNAHCFSQHTEEKGNSWRLVGALAIPSSPSTTATYSHHNHDHASAWTYHHNIHQRRIEFFFVNGRPAKQCQVRNMWDPRFNIPFILHLFCPDSDTNIIIDDQHSYVSIAHNQSKIDCFIQKALDDHIKFITGYKNDHREACKDKNFDSGHRILQKSSRLIASHATVSIKEEPACDQNSPFDNAFMEMNDLRNNQIQNEFDITRGSLDWTKERLRRSTNSYTMDTVCSTGAIAIDKVLLSHSKFIAQLDDKFLVMDYGGTLCLIDQHAADERIGLEQLQHSVLSIVRGTLSNDACIMLSKFGTISVSNILQSRQLEKHIDIDINSSQRLIIIAHEELIRKWKFDFHFTDRCDKIRLKCIPEFCGKKRATIKDFTHFVDELSDPSCSLPIFQSAPMFAQRYLSSLACRYAIMFGEKLSDDRSREIISSLSQCEMPSICAHGRPSIVSILDRHDNRWQEDIPYFRRINKRK